MARTPSGLSLFFLTPRAWCDLDSIWQYIAKHSERHADLVEAVLETCKAGAERPDFGHRRRGVKNPRVLFLNVSEYENHSVAYPMDSKALKVVRVVHGGRDVAKMIR